MKMGRGPVGLSTQFALVLFLQVVTLVTPSYGSSQEDSQSPFIKRSVRQIAPVLKRTRLTEQSAQGVFGSGGAHFIVKSEGHFPTLLDLYSLDPNFKEDYDHDEIHLINDCSTGYAKKVKLDQLGVVELLAERFNAWRDSSPIFIGLIESLVPHLRWRLVDEMFYAHPPYFVPNGLEFRSINAAVIYQSLVVPSGEMYNKTVTNGDEIGGIFISSPVWAYAGRYSRAGSIVHEAIRFLQIRGWQQFNEETLQWFVAKIMTTDPSAGETLDNPDLLMSHPEGNKGQVYKVMANQKELLEKGPQYFQAFCDQGDEIRSLFQDEELHRKTIKICSSPENIPPGSTSSLLEFVTNERLTNLVEGEKRRKYTVFFDQLKSYSQLIVNVEVPLSSIQYAGLMEAFDRETLDGELIRVLNQLPTECEFIR